MMGVASGSQVLSVGAPTEEAPPTLNVEIPPDIQAEITLIK